MATAIEQCSAGFEALASFFDELSASISGATEMPDPSDLYDALEITEILTLTSDSTMGGADFSIGAGVETISHFVGVERELSMAEAGKASAYISAVSEHDQESAFYSQNATFFPGVMSGAPTSGAQC